jgi:Ni,Fe-hydrogenase III small subunit
MDLKKKALTKSLWVFHMSAASCNNCDIEILDCLTPRHDIERFGMVLIGSIRHADVILCTGIVNKNCREIVKKLYEQAPKPCLVVAVGTCTAGRGVFHNSYNCEEAEPLDKIIPVDVYIPGCPPKPEAIIDGIVKLIDKCKSGTLRTK